MLPLVIFIVFIVGLAVGSLIANALGRLPSAEELQEEDRARARKFQHG